MFLPIVSGSLVTSQVADLGAAKMEERQHLEVCCSDACKLLHVRLGFLVLSGLAFPRVSRTLPDLYAKMFIGAYKSPEGLTPSAYIPTSQREAASLWVEGYELGGPPTQ